jgi:hypothetical protein
MIREYKSVQMIGTTRIEMLQYQDAMTLVFFFYLWSTEQVLQHRLLPSNIILPIPHGQPSTFPMSDWQP